MRELNWRLLSLSIFLCVIATLASPYISLKLGQGIDLTMGGMFLAAYVLGNRMSGKELAVELNIIQAMIGMVQGIAFMVVILAAFYYIQSVFNRDIGFNPTFWQMAIWLFVSANLGVFMGILPRNSILKDRSLPWPTGKAILSVAQTLTDSSETATTQRRRDVLLTSTGVAGFLTFLRDSLGVIPSAVGNAALNMSLGLEMAAIGLGMLVPLSVGLSGLLGTWLINVFGERVAKYAALSGVSMQNFDKCLSLMEKFSALEGQAKADAIAFLSEHGGKALEYLQSDSHFKFVVQWMMWPATAMMISAALTSVLIPLFQNLWNRQPREEKPNEASLADEHIPAWWTVSGIAINVLLLLWLTTAWFGMPWKEVLLAIAIQPVLIVAGLRILGITGSGPVSLMANATQFLFGLIWPAQIRSNLTAAYISANPQSASENVVPAFWVAQRIGGKFSTLILAQLFVIPIASLLTPLTFNLLQHTYGIGLGAGQLSAPTGLKIATLAIVMEQGLGYLPYGALTASIVAIFIGIVFEALLAFKKTDSEGNESSRFWWIPIPSALGFALILPPSLNICMALGSVASAVWNKLAPAKNGSYELYAAPLASGLIAGEAIVGSILLPTLAMLLEFIPK